MRINLRYGDWRFYWDEYGVRGSFPKCSEWRIMRWGFYFYGCGWVKYKGMDGLELVNVNIHCFLFNSGGSTRHCLFVRFFSPEFSLMMSDGKWACHMKLYRRLDSPPANIA